MRDLLLQRSASDAKTEIDAAAADFMIANKCGWNAAKLAADAKSKADDADAAN
jgi:hypothetical protein